MGEITRPPNAAETAFRLWAKPVQPMLDTIGKTASKPLAELTIPEVLAWLLVLGYAAATGLVLGQLAGNIIVTALRGPVIRR